MDKKITLSIQQNVLRDLEIEFRKAKLEGFIIPDEVFEIMRNLEDNYKKENENNIN